MGSFFYFSLKLTKNFPCSNSFSNSSSLKVFIPNVPCHIATCFTFLSSSAKSNDSISPSFICIPANFLSHPIRYWGLYRELLPMVRVCQLVDSRCHLSRNDILYLSHNMQYITRRYKG